MIYLDLLLNLTLLVALTIVSGFFGRHGAGRTRWGRIAQGVLFGGAAVIGMLRPLNLGPGLIFDGRSIMVSLCALYFGPWAGFVAAAMTILTRLHLGGTGTLMGVLVVLASLGIGLLTHYRFDPTTRPPSTLRLYLFGIAVHLAMVCLMLTLPAGTASQVIARVGPPVLLLYPLATILAGKILSDQIVAARTTAELLRAKENLATTLQSIGDAVISTDLRSLVDFMNPVAEALTGWSGADARGRPLAEVFRVLREKTREPAGCPVAAALRRGASAPLKDDSLLVARDGTERPVAASAAPIRDAAGQISGVVLVFRDQSDQRRSQRLQQLRLSLLDYATTHTLEELLTSALDETGALVQSPLGFYCLVGDDRQSLCVQQWSSRTRNEFCRAVGRAGHSGLDRAGVWADCVRRRTPLLHNDYPSLPHRQGFPSGHPQLIRELLLPIIRGDRVVAVLGVGNKPTDYTDQDVATVAYLADVTWQIVENKRTEAVLQESEALFRNLFEHHAAVKLILDPVTGNIIDANQAAEDFYGWPREQLRRMRVQDINTLSPDEVEREMEKARTRKRVYFEFRHRRADGSIRDVSVFSSRIEVKGRQLLHSIVHDITERKQIEKTLRQSELNYRDLFENAPIGVFTTNSQGQALSVNSAMARMLGCASPADALRHYGDLRRTLYVNPARRDLFLRQLRENGRVANFDYEARTADGRTVWLRMNARVAHRLEDGSFTIEGFTMDITAQVKLEAQFRQAQKMESVGRLAGGVAHDFNNMLSVILGYAELAMRKVTASEPLHADLLAISRAAERAAEVTRQLLAFARKQTIAPRVLDLNKTVENALKMLRRLIGEDIDMAWLPGKDVWPVKMDTSQIDQILANLCVNARDAIAGVGKIAIETAPVTFNQAYCRDHPEYSPGDYVLLAVSDNGCGMDKDTLEQLFEPFFTTKELGRGTGLGLATVYGIIKQNRGFVNVSSEPGKGTTFRIYLPRSEGETTDLRQPGAAPIPAGQGETVLVVEDEAAILNLSRAMLEGLGYKVHTASTTAEAMRLAEEYAGRIRLLITDVVMPDMNGRDLAERIHAFCPGLRTLFMSGYTADVIAHRGVLDEGVHFLQKPFSLKELGAKVRETLEQTRFENQGSDRGSPG